MFQKPTLSLFFFFLICNCFARQQTEETGMDLDQILQYAIQNQPVFQQYSINEEITNYQIKSSLSGWLPQIGVEADYFYFFEQPVAIFPDFENPESGIFREVRTGVPYNSNLNFAVNQPIFENQLWRAKNQSDYLKEGAAQSLEEAKINLVITVSKAFYALLLAQEQVNLTKEDIIRQERQLQDARLQYESGIADNIDYKRATIALQNSKSQLYQYQENIKIQKAVLKELIGAPSQQDIKVVMEMDELIQKVETDTLMGFEKEKRVEYQLLETRKSLQRTEVSFSKRSFIPSLSAFFNYNLIYQTRDGSLLYNRSFPNSLAGIRLNYPIFQGGRRNHAIKIASLELEQLELEKKDLTNRFYTEFQEALSNYKSNYFELKTQESNKNIAEEIYNTIQLQYQEGIKNFLEVIVSETDLRMARINYYNAVFRLLSSKLDLEKARGMINMEY